MLFGQVLLDADPLKEDNKNYIYTNIKLNWENAISYCSQLKLCPDSGCKLPNYKEALNIVKDINQTREHNDINIWTSDEYTVEHSNQLGENPKNAWIINLDKRTGYRDKQEELYVVCINDKQLIPKEECYEKQVYFFGIKIYTQRYCNEK